MSEQYARQLGVCCDSIMVILHTSADGEMFPRYSHVTDKISRKRTSAGLPPPEEHFRASNQTATVESTPTVVLYSYWCVRDTPFSYLCRAGLVLS